MKKVIFLITAFSLLILASCATTDSADSGSSGAEEISFIYNVPKLTEFEVMKDVPGKITAYRGNLASITRDGQSYRPTNPNSTIFKADIEVVNKTDKALPFVSFDTIELATADSSGNLSFSRYQPPVGLYSVPKSKPIAPGKIYRDSITFIYNKAQTPVAITKNRIPVLTMYNAKTKNAEIIDKNLYKYVQLDKCFDMVKTSSVDELEEYMNKYGITYSDTNINGVSFIQLAIINRNNELLDKALESGCDLTATFKSGGSMIVDRLDLLGLAALQCNKYACDKLIEKGLTFTPDSKTGIRNPAVVAVKQDNFLALVFISEVLKVDVAHLKIPMGWNEMDVLDFCNSRKYTQIADYISQLRNKE